jgi:hypothetical protein
MNHRISTSQKTKSRFWCLQQLPLISKQRIDEQMEQISEDRRGSKKPRLPPEYLFCAAR